MKPWDFVSGYPKVLGGIYPTIMCQLKEGSKTLKSAHFLVFSKMIGNGGLH